jgi:hypothetical protein
MLRESHYTEARAHLGTFCTQVSTCVSTLKFPTDIL